MGGVTPQASAAAQREIGGQQPTMAIVKLAGGLTVCAVAVAGCSATATTGPTATTGATTWATIAIPTTSSVQAWGKANADKFFRLGQEMSDVSQAMKAEDFDALHDACTKISAGIHDMLRAMPTPDVGLTAALQEAMDSLTVAVSQCDGLNPSSSDSDIDQFGGQLRVATGQVNVATDILEHVSGGSR
jgi:hypothetical protein